MRILLSGSHGLVGNALISSLELEGHEIFRLVRHAPGSDAEIEWSPDRYSIALARLNDFDAVVHLAEKTSRPAAGVMRRNRRSARVALKARGC